MYLIGIVRARRIGRVIMGILAVDNIIMSAIYRYIYCPYVVSDAAYDILGFLGSVGYPLLIF